LKASKISFYIITISAVLLLTMFWFWENDLFTLNRVKVVGNNMLSKEEIIELADIDFSQEIFMVDLSEIEDRLLTNNLIEKISVSRYLPSAIKIKVTEKDLIANVSCSELCALDSHGEIVDTPKLSALYDLPVITGVEFKTDSLGKKTVSPLMENMILILKAIREINFQLYHELSEIHYDKNTGIILYLKNRVLPVILGFNDYPRKIAYFSAIYDMFQDNNEFATIEAIDVRFNGQIIVKN